VLLLNSRKIFFEPAVLIVDVNNKNITEAREILKNAGKLRTNEHPVASYFGSICFDIQQKKGMNEMNYPNS
jgi:hypothetical protein